MPYLRFSSFAMSRPGVRIPSRPPNFNQQLTPLLSKLAESILSRDQSRLENTSFVGDRTSFDCMHTMRGRTASAKTKKMRVKSTPELRSSSHLRHFASAFPLLLDFSFRRWRLHWIAVVGKSVQVLLFGWSHSLASRMPSVRSRAISSGQRGTPTKQCYMGGNR